MFKGLHLRLGKKANVFRMLKENATRAGVSVEELRKFAGSEAFRVLMNLMNDSHIPGWLRTPALRRGFLAGMATGGSCD